MNLEAELNMINNTNTTEFDANMFSQPTQPTQVAQPSMVNPTTSQQQVNNFTFANLDFDATKPLYDRNPIERLAGNSGEVFRIHILPNGNMSKVHNHYNAELQRNFVCLKDAYGTQEEDCCLKYGSAKPRIIIPIIVMPTTQNQPNAVLQGQPGKLSTLVLGPSQFTKLQDQAKILGVDISSCDLVASVDNPKYKSFTFTLVPNTLIQQVPNVEQLIAQWKQIATMENICKLAGSLITRETYNQYYSNYDKSKYENNNANGTTQVGVEPANLQFNNTNQFNQPQGNVQNPWGSVQNPWA